MKVRQGMHFIRGLLDKWIKRCRNLRKVPEKMRTRPRIYSAGELLEGLARCCRNLKGYTVGIKARLIVSFAIVVCLTAVVGIYAVFCLKTVNSYLQMMADTNLARMTAMQETVRLLEQYRADTYKLLWERKSERHSPQNETFIVKDIDDTSKEIDERIRQMKRFAKENQADNVKDIEGTWEDYKKDTKAVIIDGGGANDAEIDKSLSNTGDLGKYYSKLITLSEGFKQLNEGYVNIVVRDGDARYQKATAAVIGGVGAVIVITIIIAFLFGKYINKFIRRFLRTTSQNALGNLQQQLEFKGNDEFSMIADSYNETIAQIRVLIKNIQEMAVQVSRTSDQIMAVSAQSSKVVGHVAESIASAADSVENQVENIDNTALMVDRMSKNIDDMTIRTASSVTEAQSSATIACAGGESIKQTIEQMKSISYTNKRLVSGINSLGENSGQIGQIVDTITSIARQTNLLALNAAIEAAHAGQYGKGFAVVADEVRSLAEQSQAAARQIEKIIDSIREETDRTIGLMAVNSREVDAGAEDVNKSGQSFEELSQISGKMSEQISLLSNNVTELSDSSQNVVVSVNKIHSEINNVNEQIQSTSASIEEQSASLEEIVSSSRSLADMAQKLTVQVSKFQV